MNFSWYTDPITNHYVDFEGRASRQQFWMFFLFNLVIGVIIAMVDLRLTGGFIYALYTLAVLLPTLGLGARRLHDSGKSAWLLLIALIPFAGLILLVLFALPGDPGPNEYGPPPGGEVPQPSLT